MTLDELLTKLNLIKESRGGNIKVFTVTEDLIYHPSVMLSKATWEADNSELEQDEEYVEL